MNRAGYSDDGDDQWAMIRWRGAVKAAFRGSRGQGFLRELLAALDAMPDKRLISNSFSETGAYCTLGAIGAARGVEMPQIEPDADMWDFDYDEIRNAAGEALGIAPAMAAEIMYVNDEGGWHVEDDKERWTRMRAWVAARIKEPQP